jgi:hypothetical protein
VVKQLIANAAHLFGGAWQTPPRAVVGVPARFNKYQREATVKTQREGDVLSALRDSARSFGGPLHKQLEKKGRGSLRSGKCAYFDHGILLFVFMFYF